MQSMEEKLAESPSVAEGPSPVPLPSLSFPQQENQQHFLHPGCSCEGPSLHQILYSPFPLVVTGPHQVLQAVQKNMQVRLEKIISTGRT